MANLMLPIFLAISLVEFWIEDALSALNRRFVQSVPSSSKVRETLGISAEDWEKSRAYSLDRQRLGTWQRRVTTGMTLTFLALGGLGWADRVGQDLISRYLTTGFEGIAQALVFFAILGGLGFVMSLPFSYVSTFWIEARHGFNRQTPRGFWSDTAKSLLIGCLLGAPLIAILVLIVETTQHWWWIYAWGTVVLFSIVTLWLFPTVLAPLFNKFTAVTSGPLFDGVSALAAKVQFPLSGLYIMDASKRSSHGNAYFTGFGSAKRIVLFDTLVQGLEVREVLAVLAHELGHFKLGHIRWSLLRSAAISFILFGSVGWILHDTGAQEAFGLGATSAHGKLAVMMLLLGVLDFPLQPIQSLLSRQNEFAADAFARTEIGQSIDLRSALLKMREKSHAMPVSHPWYSAFYYSHPPLPERLAAMD